MNNLIEHIRKAQVEALKQNIEANTIMIDKDIAYSNNLMGFIGQSYYEFPPMIFGMKVLYKEELPNDAGFIITETPKNKMERIQDLEEELGIDLITLFRAIKSKIIWVKINEIEYHFEDEYNERNWDLQNGFLYMYWEDGSHCCLELSNYGKTWSLDRSELENE